MALHHQIVDVDAPSRRFDPTYPVPPDAARTRILLKRMVFARDNGCDWDGTPYPAGDAARDYLLDGINEAEARLRPHAMGLLSHAGAYHG